MKDLFRRGRKISLLSFCFLLCAIMLNAGVPINGIINSYASVSAIAGTTLTVPATVGFNVGDKILIIQMKGVTIDVNNASTYGDITTYNNCGNFEYGFITALTGT